MDRPDTIEASSIEASSIADDPPSTEEAKKRIAALGLGGPRTCGRCGKLSKGRIIVGYTDFFVCFNCLVKDEAKGISETEEFTRMDRVWRIRKARDIWKSKNVVKSSYEEAVREFPEMTLKDKERLANELLKNMNMSVNSPETGL